MALTVTSTMVRYGPSGSWRAGTRIVRCSPDKPTLLISSLHEKQTAIKPRASREETESFYPMNSKEELSAIGVGYAHNGSTASLARGPVCICLLPVAFHRDLRPFPIP